MGSDGVLRSCLVTLGAVVLVVGVSTFSFKKMMATYIFGLLGIAGLVLPDWEFFDRDFGEWFSPMPVRTEPKNDRVPQIGREVLRDGFGRSSNGNLKPSNFFLCEKIDAGQTQLLSIRNKRSLDQIISALEAEVSTKPQDNKVFPEAYQAAGLGVFGQEHTFGIRLYPLRQS